MTFLALLLIAGIAGFAYLRVTGKDRENKTVTALPARLSVRYFDDAILLTDVDAWTYLRLPTISVEFRTVDEWDRIIQSHAHGLAGLSHTQIHLKTVYREYDIADWAEQLDRRTRHGASGWPGLLVAQQSHLWYEQFLQKEVYLGVRLGSRTDQTTGQLRATFRAFARFFSTVADAVVGEDEVIDKREITKWRTKAAPVQRLLRSSAFQAVPATVYELSWIFRHHMHPGMPTSPASGRPEEPWGSGAVQHLAEGVIDNSESRYYLRITQPNWDFTKQHEARRADPSVPAPPRELSSCVATLCISRIPREIDTWDGNPWIHHAEDPALGFPLEFSARLDIHPPSKAKKDVEKQLQKVAGQRRHIAGSGAEVPTGVEDAFADGRALDVEVERFRKFLVYGAGRLLVSAPDPDELTRRCEMVIEHYRNIGIDVVWSPNDQLRLFTEQFPGDRVRLKIRAYRQVQELETITAGLFTASNSLGDGEGPYLGRTTGRSQEIVYFDPLYAPRNNKPPGVAIVGAPGGGKTFTMLTIAYQAAIRGITTVLLDPKGDAKGLATSAGLGDVRILELGASMAGLLDPFSLAESRESGVLLAMETMRLLLGGELTAERENAVVSAIRYVSMQPTPNLRKVVTCCSLAASRRCNRTGRHTSSSRCRWPGRWEACLRSSANCRWETCASRRRAPRSRLPATGSPSSRSPAFAADLARVGRPLHLRAAPVGDAALPVTTYTRQLVTDPMYTGPKALVIDEAWAITQTQQGEQLVAEVARLGRSRNTALVLVSQNAKDLLAEDVRNCLTTMFIFRSEDPGEIAADIEAAPDLRQPGAPAGDRDAAYR